MKESLIKKKSTYGIVEVLFYDDDSKLASYTKEFYNIESEFEGIDNLIDFTNLLLKEEFIEKLLFNAMKKKNIVLDKIPIMINVKQLDSVKDTNKPYQFIHYELPEKYFKINWSLYGHIEKNKNFYVLIE